MKKFVFPATFSINSSFPVRKPYNLKQLEDTYLMRKVQEGDFGKMSLLYERYHRDLFGYFFRLTSDGNISEDMVQNVFYRMLKYRNSYRGEGKFIYWMYSVAKNVWFDRHRKKEPTYRASELKAVDERPDRERNPEELLEQDEKATQLRKALMQLSPEKREAIILSRFQGMKYQEIARLSDCSENAIKSRVQRGLLELKSILERIEIA